MLKKILALLLAAVMLMALAACTTSEPDSGDTQSGGNEIPEASSTEDTAAEDTNASAAEFEEMVLVDNESCTVKVTGIEEDSLWGYTLNVYLENKTDLELMFTVNNVSVNGFMCDPFWATSVTAGMKSNEGISFSGDSFETNGITTVTDIELTLDVYDNNDWMADHLVTETFTVYPLGEEAVEPYVRQAQEGELVLFDNENCTMIVTGYDPENLWGYTVNVYLENKTDKELMFSISDASVNGFMCDPFWAESVAAGKRSNTTISWMESTFEENGITEVETLSLPIRVYDNSDWLADALVEETFTVNP